MSPESRPNQKVYVIQHELGPVKIGRADRPRNRIKTLQISSPFKLKVKKTAKPTDAKAVEEYLHRRFNNYHIRGEWFDIPPEEREFEIPTHIDDAGNPDVEIETTPYRDMNNEWVDSLDRLTKALKDTKYLTSEIKDIRRKWRLLASSEDEDESNESTEPADTLDIDETPDDMNRCSQCGHMFDRTEGSCPTCASGDFVDGGSQNEYWR